MEYPADIPSRFQNIEGTLVDTEPTGNRRISEGLDPALINFTVRCLNAADSMMRCTGSVSSTHIEMDPRGTGIEYGHRVTRFDFDVYEAN